MTALPPEIWSIILQMLTADELRQIYLVNRLFYETYLDEEFKCLNIPNRRDFSADLVLRIRKPHIAQRIRLIRLNFRLLDFLPFPRQRQRSPDATPEPGLESLGFFESITATFSAATALRHLIIHVSDSRNSKYYEFLSAIWSIAKTRIQTLDLRLFMDYSEEWLTALLGEDFSPLGLRKITITAEWSRRPSLVVTNHASFPTLVKILTLYAQTLTSLSIHDNLNLLSDVVEALQIEASLDTLAVQRIFNALSGPFLRELRWTLRDNDDRPFLTSPLSGLNLLHVQTLTLNTSMALLGSPVSHLFSQPLNLSSLTSLTILTAPHYLSADSFEQVMTCLRKSHFTEGIQALSVAVNTLTEETMDALFLALPILKTLKLFVLDIVGDGRLGSALDMGDRDYNDWFLSDLSLSYGSHIESEAETILVSSMLSICRCTPSIKTLNGRPIQAY
ncbi:hypothetical protein ONZ45_g18300 [Pleurotus djamor]|nr:hypothetical protein ONZ45_g18300 [Pleurotus djamor]